MVKLLKQTLVGTGALLVSAVVLFIFAIPVEDFIRTTFASRESTLDVAAPKTNSKFNIRCIEQKSVEVSDKTSRWCSSDSNSDSDSFTSSSSSYYVLQEGGVAQTACGCNVRRRPCCSCCWGCWRPACILPGQILPRIGGWAVLQVGGSDQVIKHSHRISNHCSNFEKKKKISSSSCTSAEQV